MHALEHNLLISEAPHFKNMVEETYGARISYFDVTINWSRKTALRTLQKQALRAKVPRYCNDSSLNVFMVVVRMIV